MGALQALTGILSSQCYALRNRVVCPEAVNAERPTYSPIGLNNHVCLSEVMRMSSADQAVEKVRAKIELKKNEFRTLVFGSKGLPEEKLDFDRAIKRIDKLLDPIDFPLVKQLSEYDGGKLNILYLNKVEKLLDLDPRLLNYVLATTPFISNGDFASRVHKKEGEARALLDNDDIDAFRNLMLEGLTRWEIETDNYNPDPNNYFYLDGLPVVIKVNGLPEALSGTLTDNVKVVHPDLQGKNLTGKDIDQLQRASRLIVDCGWYDEMGLQHTESVHVVSGLQHAGIAGLDGHTIVDLDKNKRVSSLANTILHENDHHNISKTKRLKSARKYESENNFPSVEHAWLSGGNSSRVNLLEELFTYQVSTLFYYRLFETQLIDEEEASSAFYNVKMNCDNAKEAIEILEAEPECLNDDGRELLAYTKEFWTGFERDFVLPVLEQVA